MKLKIILTCFILLPLIYDAVTLPVIDRQRTKPLPDEVADVYTKERWQTFAAYKHDSRHPYLLHVMIGALLDLFAIWSPFYLWMEKLSHGSVYYLAFITLTIEFLLAQASDLPYSYYTTFTIEERYGLNRKTKKEFFHDEIIEAAGSYAAALALFLLLVFVLEHLSAWTNGFQISLAASFRLVLILCAGAFVFFVLLSLFSLFIMRRQYKFTELEDGELKTKILGLLHGCKKKIRRIEVYNESSKSTTKNAFLLKILWYRSFGIADNFINENSEDELLGVLAHEAGHLRHKKSIWNWLSYLFIACIVAGIALALPHAGKASVLIDTINASFGLSMHAWVLYITVLLSALRPLTFLLSLYRNALSRSEEYEADRNAVKEGYGEALIRTFKQLSSDELVDVNPADCIEFMEYDHPGMYHRIQAIRKAEQELKCD